MKQCESGHFYNALRHKECPYCSGESDLQSVFASVAVPSVTVRIAPEQMADAPRKEGVSTVAVIEQETGVDPVVGWLICLSGERRGRDFRLHADNNFIGRDPRMDVCIEDDLAVSRNNHAVITFDEETGKFYISMAEGRSIIRVNGHPMLSTAQLSAFDEIAIGNTRLMFYPLCSDGFSWRKKGENPKTEGDP